MNFWFNDRLEGIHEKKIHTKNIIARTAGGMSFTSLLLECNNYVITDTKYELKEAIAIGSIQTAKSRDIGADVRRLHEI